MRALADPERTVRIDSVYVPARTVTVSPASAALSPSWIRPSGDALVPVPVPPGATNHSVAYTGCTARHMSTVATQVLEKQLCMNGVSAWTNSPNSTDEGGAARSPPDFG